MQTERFGQYEVLKRLAVGGMGEIFLARQTAIKGFERLAIIKTLLQDDSDDDERTEMFLAEARIAGLLNHPNIVQIYDVGEQDGTYYIAMEFVDGDTTAALIRAALKAGRHAWWPFVPLVAQAARALHYAHGATDPGGKPLHLVHRDISPQNIMVRRDGVTKVVDFGIAKVSSDGVRTKTGIIKGKLAYMSPEQLKAEVLDGRSDLYALGVVAWELTTGRRMFHNVPDVDIFKTIMDGAFAKPTDLIADFPKSLEAAIMKTLALNPADRFQTGQEMADALDAVVVAAGDEAKENVPDYVESLIGDAVRHRTNTGINAGAVAAEQRRMAATPSRGNLSRSAMMGGAPAVDPDMPATEAGRALSELSEVSDLKTVHTASMVPPVTASRSAPAATADGPPAASAARGAGSTVGAAFGGALLALLVAAGGAYVFMNNRASVPTAAAPTPTAPAPAPAAAPAAPPPPAPAPQQPAVATAPPAAVQPAPEPRHEPKPRTSPRRPAPHRAPPPAEVARPAPATAAAPAPGYLSLASEPWATVSLGGRQLGTTPLFKVELPAGTHELKLVNEAEKRSRTLTITIHPGKVTLKKVTLP